MSTSMTIETAMQDAQTKGRCDQAWNYVTEKQEGVKGVLVCNFCQKEFRGGGINRFKKHLAGVKGEGAGCMDVDPDVKEAIKVSLKDNKYTESYGEEQVGTSGKSLESLSLSDVLESLSLSDVKKDEDLLEEPFRELTEDDRELVANALSYDSRMKVLVTHEKNSIMITGEVLGCLRPEACLNDEVVNLYLELLKERERREPKKFLKCHFFSTFFYEKLISERGGYDYKSVRRWTSQRKLGYSLLECDKIFVPVNKRKHWCLAVINKKEKKFQYLDSLGGIDEQVMGVLEQYIVDEVKDKNGEDIDVTSWKQEFVTDLPNQQNEFDCGVFMIKYADFYSRDIGLCFKQENMPYFRLRTAKEILKLRAD